MLFNSKIFVALMLVVFPIYYLLRDRHKLYFLLLVSYFFYGFWDPRLLSLIFLSTVVDFVCAQKIHQSTRDTMRKVWLGISLCTNLGMLGFFKYHDFFVGEFVNLFGLMGFEVDPQRYLLHLILPVGISFYTFQTLGYTIDIFRRDFKPEKNFIRFALYVSFFPQLVAGPVERAPHLLPQFARPFRLSREMVKEGLFLIFLGFIKKVVIADRLAMAIEPFYERQATETLEAVACQLLFTCQIYVDFSSYSDIAIGLGLLLGYNIRANFNLPFVVPSIPERWRRWHISMSHWFRDYIFIPLGGSRKGPVRTQINILMVMFLSGLWHGASNNFVMWGLGNGLTMVGHRIIKRPLGFISGIMNKNIVSQYGYFYICCFNTFLTIATINIFFRSPTWEIAKSYCRAIFTKGFAPYLNAGPTLATFPIELSRALYWVPLVFVAHELQRYFDVKKRVIGNTRLCFFVCAFMFWVIITFGIAGPQFIYYQF